MRALVCYVGDCPNPVPFVAPRLYAASFMIPVRGTKERFVSAWCNDDIDFEDRGIDSPRQEIRYSGADTVDGKGKVIPGIASQLLFSEALKNDMRAHGYFIAAGERPTEEELKAAEKARDERRRHLISDARFRFNKDRHSRNIPDDCFWAAERMGLQEDWMSIASNQCPACGVATPHTAVVCGRCGCVLDEKKYGELKFVTVGGNAQAQTKLPMGTR